MVYVITFYFALSSFFFPAKESVTYYFDAENGNNSNSGLSGNQAFQSLDKISELTLQPGDQVLLSGKSTFTNPLVIKNIAGSLNQPILVSTFGNTDSRAKIHTVHDYSLKVENSSFVKVENLDLVAAPSENKSKTNKGDMRVGALILLTETGNYSNITLNNLFVHDIFHEHMGFKRAEDEVKTANGTQSYGWGIRVLNKAKSGTILDGLSITNCVIKNVSHTGVKLTSESDTGIRNFIISGCTVEETGGPGIQMSRVINGHIFNNSVNKSGADDDTRKWGRGSGLWTWSSTNILIEKNRFTNASGPGDSAGAHIDYNCKNVVLQYNYSANNAGGFCEILGNNYNCAYRYNISVNDGHRVKGKDGAFQEGKIFWLSGYVGDRPRKGPFNSYFYNNTIYVNKNIQAKVAITTEAKGVLIANNIFHIESEAVPVKGDQYKPDKTTKDEVQSLVFNNNLFLHESSWPKSLAAQDQKPIFGDAGFNKIISDQLTDFKPSNIDLVKNKGIKIKIIPGDTVGLVPGLQVRTDILGNSIKGKPDLGAIEIQ